MPPSPVAQILFNALLVGLLASVLVLTPQFSLHFFSQHGCPNGLVKN